jgi:toxin ParE1/3/4
VKLSYSPESVQDLVRVREFIAQNNPAAAARIASELISRIEQLCAFPEIGRVINRPQSNIQVSIRDFSFGNYIVRYVNYPEAITILRIWHHYENRK